MNKENNPRDKEPSRNPSQPVKQEEKKPHSSAFNEPKPDNQKSTMNSEEADLEQERKDAMTERD